MLMKLIYLKPFYIMNEVRLPIKTSRENDKITKICVEDIYKVVNRIMEAMDKAYNNSLDIINSVHKEYDEYEGELIIGTGVSQPCHGDVFNEGIGNNIAFMKAKLNANIKKHNILCRVYNELISALDKVDEDIIKIDNYIESDLAGIRNYNPDYLKGIEEKLGL